MTYKENLLVVAMEECAELANAISMVLRFGFDEGGDNETAIHVEYHQLSAVMKMIEDEGIIQPIDLSLSRSIKEDKEAKVKYYASVSKAFGRIEYKEKDTFARWKKIITEG